MCVVHGFEFVAVVVCAPVHVCVAMIASVRVSVCVCAAACVNLSVVA